jgi:hypothetical protein
MPRWSSVMDSGKSGWVDEGEYKPLQPLASLYALGLYAKRLLGPSAFINMHIN